MPARAVRFGLDTSYLVALLSGWHERHAATLADYASRRRVRHHPVIPLQALLETYSVLTRLPPPFRVPASTAARQLSDTFRDVAEVPETGPATIWAAIAEFAGRQITGGAIYDAHIADTVFSAGAELLLTWNLRDMTRVAPPGLTVREPAPIS